jgi:hypothetical protein
MIPTGGTTMLNPRENTNPYHGLTEAQVVDVMLQLMAQETVNHYRMGQLYNYVQDSKMLDGKKYESALDFFAEKIPEVSRSALLMYGAVARDFSEESCVRFGITRLSLLRTYKVAAKIELNHSDPAGTFIGVPDKKGVVKNKLFSECSVRDLRRALEHLRKDESSVPFPAEHVAIVDRYRAAITSRFPQGTPIRVQMRDHKGEAVVNIDGVPVTQLDLLTEIFLDQLYPALATKKVA